MEGDDTLNVTTLTSPTDQAVNIVADPILVTILNDDGKLCDYITYLHMYKIKHSDWSIAEQYHPCTHMLIEDASEASSIRDSLPVSGLATTPHRLALPVQIQPSLDCSFIIVIINFSLH